MPERVLLSTLTLTRDISNTREYVASTESRLFELNALVTAENDQGNSYPLGELGKISMGSSAAC
jgi:hypothetical protein